MGEENQAKRGDLTETRLGVVVVWGIPAAVLIVSGVLEALPQAIWWPAAFGWMAAACAVNALRCRRTHCFFTAPLYLALAITAYLHGTGVISLGAAGWTWIAFAAIIGSIALIQIPEHLLGRYVGQGKAPPGNA